MSALSLAACSILLAQTAAAPPTELQCGPFVCRLYDSPQGAFEEVLRLFSEEPFILGIGEYHQTGDRPRVKSAIKRFTQSLLPLLQKRASDLVTETWIAPGRCGEVEKQVTRKIEKTIQRPATTEDEVLTLLRTASDRGIDPHILTVGCEDYQDLLLPDGQLDTERLLKTVTELMRDKAQSLITRNREKRSKKAVVLYGGALHNELEPREDWKDFSFGPDLDAFAQGRYVQLGLFVPELVESDEDARQEAWFPQLEKYVSRSKTLLISLGPRAHLLVFPYRARQPGHDRLK
jgi:hypothetical protein